MKNQTIYLPGLNGLRAIAAIGVVISHITIGLGAFGLNPFIFGSSNDGTPQGLQLAGFGVSIFFALSGFLITYLLQREKDVSGTINVRKFYIRRLLRIWPLYYSYLILAVLAMLIYGLNFSIKSLFLYIFFAANVPYILSIPLNFLTHYWSLGVEEQFYLWWPWVVKKIQNGLIAIITASIILLISVKIFFHFVYPNSIVEEAIHITRFHCMMIGALGAILYKQGNTLFLKVIDNKTSQSIALFIICLLFFNKFHVASVIDNEIISGVTLFVIIGQVNIRNRIVNLDLEIFDFLGKISYGIYVIHPLVIFLLSKALAGVKVYGTFKYCIVYSAVVGVTILTAYLSYTYFEAIFLKLKKKVSVVHSSGSKHFSPTDIS